MYALVGDLGNAFVVVAILFYNTLTLADSFQKIDLTKGGFGPFVFGQHWGEDGFCISYQKEPFGGAVHSMLLCFYFCFPWAYLFHHLAKRTQHVPAVRDKMQAKISETILHGVGHGLLWLFSDYIGKESIYKGLGFPLVLGIMAFYFFFFFSFVNNATTSPLAASVVQCSIHAVALVLIPSQLNFTYVNCVFLLNAALWPMLEDKRTKEDPLYALYAMVVNVPILLTAWLEVLGCDAFLFDWGGHLWFDASIPVMHWIYAIIVLRFLDHDEGKKKKA